MTNPTPNSERDELKQLIKEMLQHAYYNGLDRQGYSDHEESSSINGIVDLVDNYTASKVAEARESAKQEFRNKFHIDPTKKYHIVGTEKAIIVTEWEHHLKLQAQLNPKTKGGDDER